MAIRSLLRRRVPESARHSSEDASPETSTTRRSRVQYFIADATAKILPARNIPRTDIGPRPLRPARAHRIHGDDTAQVGHHAPAYARIGLFGNPSDGYFGRTISCSIQNFYAEVTLVPDQQPFSSRVSFEPGPYDWNAFNSLGALAAHTEKHGHYGGVRLLRALCCRFHAYCAERAIPLHATGFCVSYKTNIPKQTGLSGSSSIIVAGLKCLMRYYGVDIPMEDRPALVLSCETNLGINAGLQDRVIRCYEGVVSMDFTDESAVRATGRGVYTRLPEYCLPPLHLVYDENPSDSGATHATVKSRWEGRPIRSRDDARGGEGCGGRRRHPLRSGAGGTERRADRGVGRPDEPKFQSEAGDVRGRVPRGEKPRDGGDGEVGGRGGEVHGIEGARRWRCVPRETGRRRRRTTRAEPRVRSRRGHSQPGAERGVRRNGGTLDEAGERRETRADETRTLLRVKYLR